MPERADAIVVAYRSHEVIRDCVRSLLDDPAVAHVVVVNNSPGDETARRLVGLTRVTYVDSPENVGFGSAINSVRHLVRSPYVVLANPDTRQTGDTVSELVGFLDEMAEAAVAAPRMIDGMGRQCGNSKHSLSLRRMMFEALRVPRTWGVTRSAEDHRESHVSDYVIGSFMTCRRIALDEIGWFDERIFLFGEDQDLCRRLRERGWKIWFSALGTVTHFSGHSWKQLDGTARVYFREARQRELRNESGSVEAFLYVAMTRIKDVVSALLARLAGVRQGVLGQSD
jgi:GT2 family glycosyltransferase